jgi:hypothetical protein
MLLLPLPILPTIIPHLPPQVKKKTYIHMQILHNAKNSKRLGDENSLPLKEWDRTDLKVCPYKTHPRAML